MPPIEHFARIPGSTPLAGMLHAAVKLLAPANLAGFPLMIHVLG